VEGSEVTKVSTEPKKELTLEKKYERCKGHLQKVYETKHNIFMKCKKGHKEGKSKQVTHPVFMIRKEATKK
jgi:hypothetical protein